MIALELMIGGSYPNSGNGVTLARFIESSSANFEAMSQLAVHYRRDMYPSVVGDGMILHRGGDMVIRCRRDGPDEVYQLPA
jgi:hypothetical protein